MRPTISVASLKSASRSVSIRRHFCRVAHVAIFVRLNVVADALQPSASSPCSATKGRRKIDREWFHMLAPGRVLSGSPFGILDHGASLSATGPSQAEPGSLGPTGSVPCAMRRRSYSLALRIEAGTGETEGLDGEAVRA